MAKSTPARLCLPIGAATFDGLIAKIQAMGLHKGTENALIAKVEAAKKSFGKVRINAALGSLNALLNEIAAQTGKKLTAAQAGELNRVRQRARRGAVVI